MLSDDQIPSRLSPASLERSRKASERKSKHFLKGPVQLDWLCAAARLPGKCLALAVAIRFQCDISGQEPVAIGEGLCERFGIGRKAKYHCLKRLEEVGLIRVERSSGSLPRVSILNDSLKK